MNQITPEMIRSFYDLSMSEDSETAQVGRMFLKWIFRGVEVKQ